MLECKVRFASGSYYACQTGCSWGKNMEIHQTVETNPTESHQVRINDTDPCVLKFDE